MDLDIGATATLDNSSYLDTIKIRVELRKGKIIFPHGIIFMFRIIVRIKKII